jgi:DNA repair protein RAD51
MQLHEDRKDLVKLTSGVEDIDRLLGGGFETGSITELYGEARSGKTQMCTHHIGLGARCLHPLV